MFDGLRQANIEREAEQRQIDLMREQMTKQSAEQISDQILLQQEMERQDLTRWQQDLKDEITQLEHDLRNEYFDEEQNKWVKDPNLPPLINENGIKMIEKTIRPLLSRNMINSNLDDRMVYGLLKRTMNVIATNMAVYGRVYDIDFGNYSIVTRLIKNAVIPTPFRALNDGERRHLRTISKRVEAYSDGGAMAQPKKKLFGLFG